MMSKYEPLKIFLSGCKEETVHLTYTEIERIINDTLPDSAYRYRAWWGNGWHIQASAWLDAGWQVNQVKLGKHVNFVRR